MSLWWTSEECVHSYTSIKQQKKKQFPLRNKRKLFQFRHPRRTRGQQFFSLPVFTISMWWCDQHSLRFAVIAHMYVMGTHAYQTHDVNSPISMTFYEPPPISCKYYYRSCFKFTARHTCIARFLESCISTCLQW